MAYSNLSDIEDQLSESELVELTDDAGEGVVDGSVVARAIADADAEIDAYAGNRTRVPFCPVPAIIRKTSVDLAVYNLYARRQGAIPEIREKIYENALKRLSLIREGKITLGPDDPGGNPPVMGGVASTGPAQVMTDDKLNAF